jgi:tetratricopeptide (TPR) repeat protein
MTGHASAKDIEEMAYLEAALDWDIGPIDQLVKLGVLYIEPFHQEDRAIKLFKTILRRDLENANAAYWLSYCYLHYVMDDAALLDAKELLYRHIRGKNRSNGALYALLAEIIDDLNGIWRQPATGASDSMDWLAEVTYLLEQSVQLEPNWVYNRFSLSWAYERRGKIKEAIEQLRQAKRHIIAVDESWDTLTYNVEESVTGRIGHGIATTIDDKLNELHEHLEGSER